MRFRRAKEQKIEKHCEDFTVTTKPKNSDGRLRILLCHTLGLSAWKTQRFSELQDHVKQGDIECPKDDSYCPRAWRRPRRTTATGFWPAFSSQIERRVILLPVPDHL